MAAPLYDVPSGGIARLRLCATDITRLYRLKVGDTPSTVLALDGNPLEAPQSFELVVLAPGQRADIAVLMPSEEGRVVNIVDFSSQQPTILARLRAAGTSRRRDLRELAPLPKNPIAEPDLTAAGEVTLALTASAEQIAKSAFCGNLGYALWAINGTPWPGSSPDPLAPLFEMKLGRSYLVQIHNRTPHAHPVHLHGLSFRLLHSDRRSLPSIFTDTVLVLPDERVTVALVADNPGDWLLHCHVIEHQETGMTAFIRIT
jgi:FtsP/CotA-like multicopper oxidase with cupredoxin domain